jgi:hypothetical protein
MGQLAKEKIKKIEANHQPEPLSPEVEAEIEGVLARAVG